MYQVKNISGGQLVCTLASGNTLRLDDKEQTTIKTEDMTDYLLTIEKKGLIRCSTIESKGSNNKKIRKINKKEEN